MQIQILYPYLTPWVPLGLGACWVKHGSAGSCTMKRKTGDSGVARNSPRRERRRMGRRNGCPCNCQLELPPATGTCPTYLGSRERRTCSHTRGDVIEAPTSVGFDVSPDSALPGPVPHCRYRRGWRYRTRLSMDFSVSKTRQMSHSKVTPPQPPRALRQEWHS